MGILWSSMSERNLSICASISGLIGWVSVCRDVTGSVRGSLPALKGFVISSCFSKSFSRFSTFFALIFPMGHVAVIEHLFFSKFLHGHLMSWYFLDLIEDHECP